VLKPILGFILIIFFTLSGQTSEICFDDCDDTQAVSASVEHHSSAEEATEKMPLDCNCESHSHSCCSHFSVISIFSNSLVITVVSTPLVFGGYSSDITKSPCLDGPFQPPKV